MTTYTIEGLADGPGKNNTKLEAQGLEAHGGGEYAIKINGSERKIRVIATAHDSIEFLLDGAYHRAKYLSRSTREMSLVVDGAPMTLGINAELDDIVYKNSGGGGAGGGAAGASTALKSQIPGKVVSVAVSDGDTVAKGDVVCTLESMKMQVAIKAHRDGTIKSIKARESVTFAKGDVIAEIE